MARYLEYDTMSGHIISELKADKPPTVSLGISLMELDDDAEIDIGRYVVKDGKLQTIYETNAEKDEQSRIKREYAEKVRMRVRNMMSELCVALLEDNDEKVERLRQEYKNLRANL
ncbi:MAG: hypothetical protein IJM68_00625 [Synergistaceae bacterium]|nr:hypothetical protein [Synergistaceae bacterium]